jgi:hypothetical protein
MKKNYLLLIITLLLVLATVVYGFVDGGSPKAVRSKRNDEARVTSIRAIKSAVDTYYSKNTRLPRSLAEIGDKFRNGGSLVDPETKQSFEYKITGDKSYEVCAVFATSTLGELDTYRKEFEHPAGQHCFEFNTEK